MSSTLDQLQELSDHEINFSIGEKMGIDFSKRFELGYMVRTKVPDYCNELDLYVPILIDNRISVVHISDHLYCFYKTDKSDKIETDAVPSNQLGRAVCIAFLLMNGESND